MAIQTKLCEKIECFNFFFALGIFEINLKILEPDVRANKRKNGKKLTGLKKRYFPFVLV